MENNNDEDDVLLKEKELLIEVKVPCLHCRGKGCLLCDDKGFKVKNVPFILMQRSYE